MFGQYLLSAMMIIITLINITITIDMIICTLTIEVGNRSDQVQTRNSQIYNDRVLYREVRRVKQSDESTKVHIWTAGVSGSYKCTWISKKFFRWGCAEKKSWASAACLFVWIMLCFLVFVFVLCFISIFLIHDLLSSALDTIHTLCLCCGKDDSSHLKCVTWE